MTANQIVKGLITMLRGIAEDCEHSADWNGPEDMEEALRVTAQNARSAVSHATEQLRRQRKARVSCRNKYCQTKPSR